MTEYAQIYYEEYESFLDSIQQADQMDRYAGLRIHFGSLYEKLDPVQQVLVLQMCLKKVHKPCVLSFPFPKDGSISQEEYRKYIQELGKLENVYLEVDRELNYS